jgi:hypothetical protein
LRNLYDAVRTLVASFEILALVAKQDLHRELSPPTPLADGEKEAIGSIVSHAVQSFIPSEMKDLFRMEIPFSARAIRIASVLQDRHCPLGFPL